MNKRKLFMIWVFVVSMMHLAAHAQQHPHNEVPTNAEDVCPIKVGRVLPDVTVRKLSGETSSLNTQLNNQPSIIILYRGSWCPYCNTQLGELQTKEAEFKALGYQIVAISPDLPKNLKKSVSKNSLSYKLLSDSKAALAKALGLAYRVDDKTNEMLLSYKINLEEASGENHRILPVPAAIIIGKDQVVDFIYFSPNYKVRVDPEVLLAAAKAALK